MKFFLWLIVFVLIISGNALAVSISDVNGDIIHKGNVNITGENFGTKDPAAPLKWDDVEDGTKDTDYTYYYNQSSNISVINTANRGLSKFNYSGNIYANVGMGFSWLSGVSAQTTIYVYYYAKRNFNFSNVHNGEYTNFKVNRFAKTGAGSRPNVYIQIATQGAPDSYVAYSIAEFADAGGNTGSPNGVVFDVDSKWPKDSWALFETLYKISNTSNGFMKFWVNGDLIVNSFGIDMGCDTMEGTIGIGVYNAREVGALSTDRFYQDDIYVDNTQSRVMIGNNINFNNCTHREIQIPTAWSDTDIIVQFNQGSFADGAQAYLFVIDADGNASSGYPITIGGTTEDTDAPVVSGQLPVGNATDVAKDTSISFHVTDAGKGVDRDSIKLYIDDVAVATTITGSASDYYVTTQYAQSFDYGQIVDIKINAQDLADTPNVMPQVHYTFTVEEEPVSGTQFAVGNAGNADNYTKLTASRWETTDESGNIVFSINTSDITPNGDRMGEYVLYNLATYSQFDISCKARSDEDLTTNTYGDYGIIFGYVDADNYYYVLFNSNSASNQMFSVVNGTRTEIASYAGALITDNAFHTIRVRYESNTITAYFDGTAVMTASGVTVPQGKLGFGSYNDAASFDDVTITDLGAGAAPEDVDANGIINATDVGIVRDQVIDKTPKTSAGDVNSSGTVDSSDVQQVANKVE